MINKILLMSLILLNYSCSTSLFKKNLRKLSDKELIDRAKENKFYPKNIDDIIYRDSLLNIISLSELEKYPNIGDWTVDHYVNNDGTLKEYRLRKKTQKDIALKDTINLLLESHTVRKIETIEIDCSIIKKLLEDVYISDTNSRKNDLTISSDKDYYNLEIVINIIENCGMPTLKEVDKKHLQAIWLTLQHNNNYYRKKYFKYIKNSVENGELELSYLAMMEDRILVGDGKPQLYGTQVKFNESTKKWELCPISEPSLLEKRREKVGLEPINIYLNQWNIQFESN